MPEIYYSTKEGVIDEIDSYYRNGTDTFQAVACVASDFVAADATGKVDYLKFELPADQEVARVPIVLDAPSYSAPNAAIQTPLEDVIFENLSVSVPAQMDSFVIVKNGSTSSPAEVTAFSGSPTDFTVTGHGHSAGDEVFFTVDGTESLTGIAVETIYFVIAAGLTTDAFRVATTSGGSAISAGGSVTGTLYCHYANGIVIGYRHADNGVETINPGSTKTFTFGLGTKLASVNG